MRLKEIHIKGFKSFADGVRLRFEGGITGVVGPNGCGKSNFVDAMRWVLGEQRARILRTERMHQLIFNGTKDRKALHLAEVTINLDQTKNLLPTEHQNLEVTRRIYRSGESEYAINGIPARLKDITDLMLDSGMSTEAYSIIELKMIEEILSNKESARRQLFEHAAGIAKFKSQRKEAIHRLRHAEADLKRIADLIHELEQNLGTLERQAKRALKYKHKQRRYTLMRSLQASGHAQQLEARQKDLERQLHQEEGRRRELHSQLHTLDAAYTSEKKGYEEKEKKLQQAQRTLNEADQQLQEVKQSLALSKSQSLQLSQRKSELERDIKKQKHQETEGAARVRALEAELKAAETLSTQTRTGLEEASALQTQHQKVLEAAEASFNELKKETTQKQADLQQLHHQKQLKEAQLYQLKEQQKQLDEAISAQNASDLELKEQQRTLALRVEGAEQRLGELFEAEQSIRKRISAQEQLTEERRSALRSIHQKIQQKEEQIKWIEEISAKMEGASASIRWLRKTQSYAAPLLMEILEINPVYAEALTMYLAPVAQHFIVEQSAEAEGIIEELRKEAQGQASFFILEEIKLLGSTEVANPPSDLTSARAQVRCDAAYTVLCDWLLQEVYIVKDRATAHSGRAIINKDGTWIYETGTLRGGHRSKQLPSDVWV